MAYKEMLMALLLYTLATNNGVISETANSSCDCGKTQNERVDRIVNGAETGVNQYPFAAALIKTYPDITLDEKIYCSAVIISNRYALCTAHCYQRWNISNFALMVGEHKKSTDAETNATKIYEILSYRTHQKFIFKNLSYDIGLIKTKEDIQYSASVGPVCLPYNYERHSFVGQPVKVMGWGKTSYDGRQSDVLREVDLTVVSNYYCAENTSSEIPVRITTDKICAYHPTKDACQYDSGAPLLWHNGHLDRYILIGIAVSGVRCGENFPGVYTRITSYIPWILANIEDHQYCTKN